MIKKRSIADDAVHASLQALAEASNGNPLELIQRQSLSEKLVELVLQGVPALAQPDEVRLLKALIDSLANYDTAAIRVVVLGGGTGLSTVIGGDSRNPLWYRAPFSGIKDVFPQTTSIVCVTDDGGSTGELLKDLPLIALGDIRHVMLSSIRKDVLEKLYGLDQGQAMAVAKSLHTLFNFRFTVRPESLAMLLEDAGVKQNTMPGPLQDLLTTLLGTLFTRKNLVPLLDRPHCLGNLLLAAAVYAEIPEQDESGDVPSASIIRGLGRLSEAIGCGPQAVLPCTTTPSRLQVLYSNGVLVTGEFKSGHANRYYPVNGISVEFASAPVVPQEVLDAIRLADIIILAPGSLYSSTIPVLQTPAVAEAIRRNDDALKILISNLWVQKGETDLVWDDPGRRFYISDLVKAYHRTIPGGVQGLFRHMIVMGYRDIPASILQNYAVEGKVPISLDRDRTGEMGLDPVEAEIFSQAAMMMRRVIQHDPVAVAKSLKTMWAIRKHLPEAEPFSLPPSPLLREPRITGGLLPNERYAALGKRLRSLSVTVENGAVSASGLGNGFDELRKNIQEIIWYHADIPVDHLDHVNGITLVEPSLWDRSQKWDNVFSYYEPATRQIRIRHDMIDDQDRFEVAFFVALGQAVLGDYCSDKRMEEIRSGRELLGKVFRLTLKRGNERLSFLDGDNLDTYLVLTRMVRSEEDERVYTRLINGSEGFTPPGLLFGLLYAWYLDNRFASHIEYKMAVMRNELTDLIPEQVKIYHRRHELILFFRQVVFRHSS